MLPSLQASSRRIALCALVGLLVCGCERAPVHPGLRTADLPALIPAYEFVFHRDGLGEFSFSPDGSRLRWTGPSWWGRRLHVRNDDGSIHRYRVGGSTMHWSADGRRLLILADQSGAENHHLYRLDLDDPDAEARDLTPYPGVRVWLYRILDSDPQHVLVLHNRRDRNVRDLYRIDLASGAEELIATNPGDAVAPVTDAQGAVLGWRKSEVAERPRGKPRPAPLRERSALSRETEDKTQLLGVSGDHRRAWVLSNKARERTALFEVDTATGVGRLVYEDPHADVGRVVMSKRTGEPLMLVTQADYPRIRILDPALEADLKPLLNEYAGMRFGYDVVSMDAAEKRFVISMYTHADRRYYLLDRGRKTYELLGGSGQEELGRTLSVPEAVEFRSRDGLTIPAYLVRPPGTEGKRVPLVVLVHGGPWSRVVWSDPRRNEDMLRAHFLANRGYAVLAINFRGSTGYGRSFLTAAVGEVGGRMQDDLADGARWAIEQGIADPGAIAIMGHSYGGYASLMALVRDSSLFACAVDIAGPTDLVRLIEEFPPYWELELSYWYHFVGDPAVPIDRERMRRTSPLALADRIEHPVLIVQGKNDVRVRAEQSVRMVEALRSRGRRVQYVAIPEMGHSLGYWAHHLRVLRAAETFLADCLGGRAARFDALEWAARLSGRLPLFD
ncbi:MAG: S9 family peptidase [Burkholderiales bacterium]|nr:S9 family peptidase [Burkholderiales bacterium]